MEKRFGNSRPIEKSAVYACGVFSVSSFPQRFASAAMGGVCGNPPVGASCRNLTGDIPAGGLLNIGMVLMPVILGRSSAPVWLKVQQVFCSVVVNPAEPTWSKVFSSANPARSYTRANPARITVLSLSPKSFLSSPLPKRGEYAIEIRGEKSVFSKL